MIDPFDFEDEINPKRFKPIEKIVELKIEKYANEGVSISYFDNKTIFVRYAIPGEIVKAKIYRETKDYAVAEPIEIIKPSEFRIPHNCKYFGICGGCDYQMISYEEQIKLKSSLAIETLNKIGKLNISSLNGVIKSPSEFHYRNTETFKVNPKQKKIGFFRKDSKSVVDIEECKLAMNGINVALKSIRNMKEFPPHNFKVRTTNNNDITVNWIKSDFEDKDVIENIKVLDMDYSFKISKDSFFQVNNSVIPLWLNKIIEFIKDDKTNRIFDLFCGIGLITLFVGRYASETVGLEISKSAVKDAEFNLKLNNIKDNIKFFVADVNREIHKFGKADVVIIDPPRKGLDNNSLNVLKTIKAKKIIYSSCKVSTFARDLNVLSDTYKIKEVYLVDMFPQTQHMEMLSLLELK